MTDHQYSDGIGVLGVQVFFEVLVLGVFLWARKLAARACPADPSGEAKILIWVLFAGDAFAEVAFINIQFLSREFWVLLLLDFFMIVMRDADLWDEFSELLRNLCGKRLGKILTFMVAISTGEQDLAAGQLEDEMSSVEGSKTRMRRFIKVRMVASQAVASEFVGKCTADIQMLFTPGH